MRSILLMGLLALLSLPCYAQDPSATTEAFMTALYKRLAKTRNAVLIDAPAENAAAIGRVYMYEEPRCYIPNSKIVEKGIPISLVSFDSPVEVGDITRTLREPKVKGSYSMSRELAAEVVAEIKKNGLLDGKVSPKALVDALSRVDITFRVVRTEVDFAKLHQRLQPKAIDLSIVPSDYEGLLTPIAQFAIADFSYDASRTSTISAGLGLDASFLNKLLSDVSAKFSAERKKISDSSVEIDTTVTFAFKPNVLMARHQKCSKW